MNHSPGWNLDNLNARMLHLWSIGLDTFAIGKKVGRSEFEVYNRLWHLRNGK